MTFTEYKRIYLIYVSMFLLNGQNSNIKTFIYEPLNKGHTDIEKTCIIVIEIFFKRKYKCIVRPFYTLYTRINLTMKYVLHEIF